MGNQPLASGKLLVFPCSRKGKKGLAHSRGWRAQSQKKVHNSCVIPFQLLLGPFLFVGSCHVNFGQPTQEVSWASPINHWHVLRYILCALVCFAEPSLGPGKDAD